MGLDHGIWFHFKDFANVIRFDLVSFEAKFIRETSKDTVVFRGFMRGKFDGS